MRLAMGRSVTTLILPVVALFSNALSLSTNPDFCRNLECPHFEELKSVPGKYELRRYPDYAWAATYTEGLDYEGATRRNFKQLLKYITGHNKLKRRIPMTTPVLNQIIITPTSVSNFTMHFFLPFSSQSAPPEPLSNNIRIVRFTAVDVYVRAFGGFGRVASIQSNALALIQDLAAEGLSTDYDDSIMYVAGYDGPFRLTDRHNEIWFLRKSG